MLLSSADSTEFNTGKFMTAKIFLIDSGSSELESCTGATAELASASAWLKLFRLSQRSLHNWLWSSRSMASTMTWRNACLNWPGSGLSLCLPLPQKIENRFSTQSWVSLLVRRNDKPLCWCKSSHSSRSALMVLRTSQSLCAVRSMTPIDRPESTLPWHLTGRLGGWVDAQQSNKPTNVNGRYTL